MGLVGLLIYHPLIQNAGDRRTISGARGEVLAFLASSSGIAMKLTFLKAVNPSSDQINKVTAIAFSPNNLKLAVATQDRVIQLFDETGERKDRFSTKPNLVCSD